MAKPKKKYSDLTKEEKKYVLNKLGITSIKDIDTAIIKSLKEELKKLKDIRCHGKIIYKLWDVIICQIIASFAGCNSWEETHDFVERNYTWFKSFLQMTGGIPSIQSYERIIGLVDSKELNEILFDFYLAMTQKRDDHIKAYNFDGRVNNGSKRKETLMNGKKEPLNCLNCYSTNDGYCIETVPIDSKTNEIPTIEELIKGMNLNGIVATWDALNTQKNNVAAVINAFGDYVVPIKENQKDFYTSLVDYFDEDVQDEIRAGNKESEYYTMTEKSHASIIKYEYFQTSDVSWYDRLADWTGVKSFGLVKKTITKLEKVKNTRKNAKSETIKKEVTTTEYRYYISSLNVDVNVFARLTRGHWNVENKVHWHLDFTFRQDDNRTCNKNALLNLEIINKFVLATLNRVKPRYKKSLRMIRFNLGLNIRETFTEFMVYLMLAK